MSASFLLVEINGSCRACFYPVTLCGTIMTAAGENNIMDVRKGEKNDEEVKLQMLKGELAVSL